MESATACAPMGRPRLDLRHRIAAVVASVCIALVGGLGLTLYMASEEMETALVEQLVSEEMDFLVKRGQLGDVPVATEGPNLHYYVLRRPDDYRGLNPALRGLGPGQHNIGHGAEELHVAVRDAAGVRYIVTYDAGAHEV